MKRAILATCMLVACASEPSGSDFTGTDGETDGTGTGSASTQTGGSTGDASSDSVGSGTSGSAGSDGSTVGPGSDSDSSSGSSSTSGGGTGTTADSTSGSTSGNSGSTGTTSGDTTGGGTTGGVMGEMKFPGDECNPFTDWCLDAGGNYECQQTLNPQIEITFVCTELNDTWGDGGYAARCDLWPSEQCQTGLWCRAPLYFPPNTCTSAACCIDVCVYQEICGNGKECEVLIWQADLAGYLDQYTGIGVCPL